MARREDLEFKIRALVEGTREVQQLEREINELHQEARQEVPDTTGRFRRGLRQAQDSARRARDEIFSLRGAMVGIASAAAAGAVIQRTLAATAALDEQADSAGLNVERFQELTKAFSDMAGVAESTTAGALRRFNRRLGLARQGTGAAADTLERLSINLQQDTGPALEEAIEKLANMDDNADRAAAASQLFGEDAGPRLAAALAQGQDALDETIAKLREQGRIMSNEGAESARRLNDRYNELADTLDTNFKRAVVGATDALLDLFEAQGEVPQLMERLNELRDRRSRLLDNLDDSPFPGEMRKEINAVNEEILRLQQRLEDLRNRGDRGGAPEGLAPGTLTEVERQLEFLNRDPAASGGGGGSGTGWVDPQRSAIGIALENLEGQANETSDAIDQIGEIQVENPTVMEITRELEQSLADLGDQAGETGEDISQFTIQAKRNIESQLGDTLRNVLEDDFDSIEDAWRQMLYNMATEAAAAQLSNALFGQGPGFSGGAFGAAANWVAGFFHSGGIAGEATRMASVSPLAFAGAPRYHEGGMAGLRRDEVPAILKRGEEILPTDSPRHSANGGGQAPQVNLRTVNVIREEDVADAMSGAPGERVVLNIIGRNPESVRETLEN